MIGIGIGRDWPGLAGINRRDYGTKKKVLVGIAGFKNPIGDPLSTD